ncbi:MAG TPA: hypothetical protein PKM25_16800, partial [Candidatus Ozemobacteraceae bacterium]|nr:hypothetical protein [Candidatus Ozemobacteraceae bacterium]
MRSALEGWSFRRRLLSPSAKNPVKKPIGKGDLLGYRDQDECLAGSFEVKRMTDVKQLLERGVANIRLRGHLRGPKGGIDLG